MKLVMETASSRKVLRLALFILVPAEYLSMFFSRLSPNIYGDVPLTCAILIPAATLVCLLSWKTHRVVAALGLLPSLLRACLKIPRGAVFEQRAEWRGATRENTLHGSSTEEQRRQAALCSKTLRAAGLLFVGRVGSVVTAHYGDAPPSPPCPQPKSLAAASHAIFRQALRFFAYTLPHT